MEKINYFALFVKAIVFAFIILALKTFLAGMAADAKQQSILKQAEIEARQLQKSRPCNGYIKVDWLGRYHDNYGICKFTPTSTSVSSDYPVILTPSRTDYITPRQTHYSGVVHGSHIGDWYTFEVTGN